MKSGFPNPDYDFGPLEWWIGEFVSQRDSIATTVQNGVMEVSVALLVVHLAWTSLRGLAARESGMEIAIGRWLFPVVIQQLFVTQYHSFFGPLSLSVGSLGQAISGWSALDPMEILLQGMGLSGKLLLTGALISPLPGNGAGYMIMLSMVVFFAHLRAAYQVTKVIFETLVLFMVGPLAMGLGMSAWTWGSSKAFLKLSFRLGFKIVMFHIVLKLGDDAIMSTVTWVVAVPFFGWVSALKATGMGVIYAFMVSSIPEQMSREISDGLFSDFGNPFSIRR